MIMAQRKDIFGITFRMIFLQLMNEKKTLTANQNDIFIAIVVGVNRL